MNNLSYFERKKILVSVFEDTMSRIVLPTFMYHFKTIEFAVYCPSSDQANYLAFEEALAGIC